MPNARTICNQTVILLARRLCYTANMPYNCPDDADIYQRHLQDRESSVLGMIERRIQSDIRPSFDEAYRRMSAEGKPGLFMLKTGSVALGSFMMADGMYHIIGGNDERVNDLFLDTLGRNYTRIFAGSCELAAGAVLAYLGAVKGPVR